MAAVYGSLRVERTSERPSEVSSTLYSGWAADGTSSMGEGGGRWLIKQAIQDYVPRGR